ncbi:hypothetical protein AWC38_SpisGene11922 [Stylophora pistillata]|uniref:Laminin G domain-containing protein n=1 Tax=Stylophora pistillata TaxID=50429 RepID=A0A2B4S4J5_STYPI|nr:hypothetical protein AWC38_SpisGene11922 [Stylophora pistillata]
MIQAFSSFLNHQGPVVQKIDNGCTSIKNCQHSAPQAVASVLRRSFADGRWHKFNMFIAKDVEDGNMQCKVDEFFSQKVKYHERLVDKVEQILYLGGRPDTKQQRNLDGSFTCLTKTANFSGCVADLEISFRSSGTQGRLNMSHIKQFGDVSTRCIAAIDNIVSFSDKNSKIVLMMKDIIKLNTSLEFQIRTSQSRAFVGKIMNQIFTALFFLEMGRMKVFVRLAATKGHKGDSFHLTSGGTSLSDNYWYRVAFHFSKETGAYLFIEDALRGQYQFKTTMSAEDVQNGRELSHVTIRFGRSARKYPGLIGCLRDVIVNSRNVNFTQLNSKGISVGDCEYSPKQDRSNLEKDKNKNKTVLWPTKYPFSASAPLYRSAPETTKKSIVSLTLRSNASGGTFKALTTQAKQRFKNESSFDKTYPIAVTLAVGFLVMIFVITYVVGVGLTPRIQKCFKRTSTEDKDKTENNSMRQAEEDFSNLPKPGRDKGSHAQYNSHALTVKKLSGIGAQENLRSGRGLDKISVKVWEERYLCNAACTAADSNFLTITKSYYTQVPVTRSQEELSKQFDITGKAINNTPRLNESITLQNFNHGSPGQPSSSLGECNVEIRTMTNSNPPQSPRQFNKAYSGHSTLPKPKKTPSLSWAYGRRFIRNESSDTECSDVDKVTRARPRNFSAEPSERVMKPRQLKFLESSEDEMERRRAPIGRRTYGRIRKLQTFSEETSFKLYLLKEEEKEVDLDQRRPFTANRLKVYLRDRSGIVSFVETSEHCDDSGSSIGVQARAVDGYTSSCPESINCLSEKDDSHRNYRYSKRLTTHYF